MAPKHFCWDKWRVSGASWDIYTKCTHLESPGPKYTPTPADANGVPFLNELPSVYIRSIPGIPVDCVFVAAIWGAVLYTTLPVAGSNKTLGSKPSSAPVGNGPSPGAYSTPSASFGFSIVVPGGAAVPPNPTGGWVRPSRTNSSASSRVENLRYRGRGKPRICSCAVVQSVYTPVTRPRWIP